MSLSERELQDIVTNQPGLPNISDTLFWTDHLFSAVARKFGKHVRINNFEDVKSKLKSFVDELQFEVVYSGTKKDPRLTQPCIIDISYKEFCNNNGYDEDNSIVRVGKNSSITSGVKYLFHPKNGVRFDDKCDLGSQIVSIAMTGGFIRVGDVHDKKDQKYNKDLTFQYDQKEKVTIPTDKKVRAKITTSTWKYELEYTLKFFTLNHRDAIPLSLINECQKFCCCILDACCCYCCFCCRPREAYLSAADLLQDMPNFEVFPIEDVLPSHLKMGPPKKSTAELVCLDECVCDDSNITMTMCSFTIDGILTWIGEDCKIEKVQSEA